MVSKLASIPAHIYGHLSSAQGLLPYGLSTPKFSKACDRTSVVFQWHNTQRLLKAMRHYHSSPDSCRNGLLDNPGKCGLITNSSKSSRSLLGVLGIFARTTWTCRTGWSQVPAREDQNSRRAYGYLRLARRGSWMGSAQRNMLRDATLSDESFPLASFQDLSFPVCMRRLPRDC